MKLTGKTVLVTGGNDGLGREIVIKLAEKQCRVILLGKDQQRVDKAVKEINKPEVRGVVCNLRDREKIHESVQHLGQIDILINCAGIIGYSKLEEQDLDNIAEIIETNLLGAIYITREVIGGMKQNNRGAIVNISSTSGLPTGGHANEAVYMASKYGLAGFTDGLKKEVREEGKNIRVVGFYPGGMNTQLFAKSGEAKDLGKFINPAEMAEIVVFILERPDAVNIDHIVINRNINA